MRRARVYRGSGAPLALRGCVAVVVDDGIATGATARAACRICRARGATRVVLAAPVGAASSVAGLRRDADEVICVATPRDLSSIGEFYEDFGQTGDLEVCSLLGAVAGVPTATQTVASDRASPEMALARGKAEKAI